MAKGTSDTKWIKVELDSEEMKQTILDAVEQLSGHMNRPVTIAQVVNSFLGPASKDDLKTAFFKRESDKSSSVQV